MKIVDFDPVLMQKKSFEIWGFLLHKRFSELGPRAGRNSELGP